MIDLLSDTVRGRIPTGWYPSSVSASADGCRLYIVNTKANAGPDPANGSTAAGTATDTNFRNEYDLASEKGGLLTVPIPNGAALAYLSAQVDANNLFYVNTGVSPMIQFLRTKIKHIIFIQRENRAYDQIHGDLPIGNGDQQLTVFPQPITPTHTRARCNARTLPTLTRRVTSELELPGSSQRYFAPSGPDQLRRRRIHRCKRLRPAAKSRSS